MWLQILKQIANQWRANSWIVGELFVVLILLWYGVDLIYNYEGAAMQPKGYDTENVFHLQVGSKPLELIDDADNRRAGEDFLALYKLIEDYPGVEEVCYYYGTTPYVTNGIMTEGYSSHADSSLMVASKIRYVSPSYFRVFKLEPLAGVFDEAKWLQAEYPMPALMSKALADSLFHTSVGDAVGKTCFNPYFLRGSNPRETNYKVMAVLPDHKIDDYQRYEPFIYLPASDVPLFWQSVAIRVHPDYVAGFAERFKEEMQQPFDRGIFYLETIRSYADMKASYDIEQGTVNYLNTIYAVIMFFICNVFLTVLSTFWFRTRKRYSEIALRMALGSSRRGILRYYVTEGICLLGLSTIPALPICINLQLADLTVNTLMDASVARFIGCFASAWIVLAIIIIAGIWLPARKAMRIQPAEALHDE